MIFVANLKKSIVGEQTAHKAITNQLKHNYTANIPKISNAETAVYTGKKNMKDLSRKASGDEESVHQNTYDQTKAAPKQLLVSRTYVLRGHSGLLNSPTPTLLPKEPFLISESVGMHLIMQKQGYTCAISVGEPERKSHKS